MIRMGLLSAVAAYEWIVL